MYVNKYERFLTFCFANLSGAKHVQQSNFDRHTAKMAHFATSACRILSELKQKLFIFVTI